MEVLEEFTCKLYGDTSKDINATRYKSFCATTSEKSLPPCKDALLQHIKRCSYQAAIHHRSLHQTYLLHLLTAMVGLSKTELLMLSGRLKLQLQKVYLRLLNVAAKQPNASKVAVHVWRINCHVQTCADARTVRMGGMMTTKYPKVIHLKSSPLMMTWN